jgi:signal transduction histidine kinase
MIAHESDGFAFLKGGGEMGEVIRSKDWQLTPIGSLDNWPQSLRTAVSIILNSQFPMFVWWGSELTTIYNDTYSVVAGEKHPEALGSPGRKIWAEIWDVIAPLVDKVMLQGASVFAEDQLLYINRHGYVEEAYFTFSYSPIFDEVGGIGGVFCVCSETTEKVLANRRIYESEQSLRRLFAQAPVAICIVSGDAYVVEMANEGMLEFLGRTPEIIGKPVVEALPEARQQGLIAIFDIVRKTSEPYLVNNFPAEIRIEGVRETRYFDLVFKPYLNNSASTEVNSIFCIAHNVTEQVLNRKRLEENESGLQKRVEERTADVQKQKAFIGSILDASFNGIYALKAARDSDGNIIDFYYLFANDNIARLFHLNASEMIGTSMLQLIPENKDNGFYDLFCKVLLTGEAVHDVTHFVVKDINSWYDYIVVPIDQDTLVVTIHDITDQKLASLQIEHQRNLLNSIMNYSPAGIAVTEVIRDEAGEVIDGRIITANEVSEKFLGIPLAHLLHRKLSENDPQLLQSSLFKKAVQTLTTGRPFIMQYFFESTQTWLELSIAKMDENRLINVFTDVTTIKKSEFEMVQSVERLAAVFDSAQSAMFTLSPVYDEENKLVDFRFVITNSNFAAYVNQTPETLNGAVGSAWFPGYLTNGVFDMCKKTFTTGETQRKEVQYHVNENSLYLDLKSTKVRNEVLVTFTDYTELKKAQLQLEKHIEELKRSNANLEEFAHAASHDLKEPVRKVRVYSDRLKSSLGLLNNEQQNLFFKVEDSTYRMGLLIDDLLDYSHVSMGVDLLEKIDLNKKLQVVVNDLEIAIYEKGATVSIGELPTIMGHRRQIQQVFHNLIQNALKYSKKDVAPIINISSQIVIGYASGFVLPEDDKDRLYHLISIRDNGIGFDQKYADRIFEMFKRLHTKTEYKGTGVGLAIVRKVIENHKGFIAAEGRLGEGAIFKVLLPVD